MKSFLSKYSAVISIFFSYYIILSLNLYSSVSKQQMVKTFKPDAVDFFSLFNAHNVEQLLRFLFCYILIKRVLALVSAKPSIDWKNWVLYSVPAVLFSSFMFIGFSFKTTGLATGIAFSKYQILKSFFAGGGFFILFLCLIVLLFERIDKISLFDTIQSSANSFWFFYNRHPFILSYLLLLSFYTPYIVISYPGIFMGDTWDQISQGYNLRFLHPAVNLISEEVRLINHHPVFHTLLLHSFIVVGKLIRSYNFGIFLFAFFQLNLFISVISFSIMVLTERFHLKPKYAFAVLLYFLIHPFVQNYMMLIVKDVWFTLFFLLFLLFSCIFLEQRKLSVKQYLLWNIFMLGMVLFRNEGIYLIVPTLLYWLCLNVSKKQICSSLMMIVCFFLIWHHAVFPFFKISPGSVREMLSIPFQQTARYVKYRPQKVTLDEIAAIDAVLDYKIIGNRYNPGLSDPVKWTFKEKSTKKQRLRYLKTWIKMFFKEPILYIDAVVANKFEYFNPKAKLAGFYSYSWSKRCMEDANKNKDIPFAFHHLKKMEKYREKYERFRAEISGIPIINVLRSASTYVWMLVLLIFYTLKQGNKKAFALLAPFIMHFLVLMAGPTNGTYFRYIYPYIVTFPFLLIFIIYLRNKFEREQRNSIEDN